jgi:hypothetical protein
LNIDGKKMLVTSAVDELLFHQRSMFTSKLFWIDAICIDQKTNSEKNEQLPMMADIYRRASRVVVWLGAPESRKETHTLRKFIGIFNYPEWYESINAFLPYFFDNEEEAYIAVGKLLSHPWFERIWIVQEVAVGKTVHVMYHGTCINWEILAAVIKRLCTDGDLKRGLQYYNSPNRTNTPDQKGFRNTAAHTIPEDRPSQVATITSIRNSIQIGSPSSLPLLFPITNMFKATNPRDKVFAILGEAHKAGR